MLDLLKEDNIEDFKELLSVFAYYFQYNDYDMSFEDFKKINNTVKLRTEEKETIPLSFDINDLKRLLKIDIDKEDADSIIQNLIDNIDTKYEIRNENEFVKGLNKLYNNNITKKILDNAFSLSSIANITKHSRENGPLAVKYYDSNNIKNYVIYKHKRSTANNDSTCDNLCFVERFDYIYRFEKAEDLKGNDCLKLVESTYIRNNKGTHISREHYIRMYKEILNQNQKYYTLSNSKRKKRSKS